MTAADVATWLRNRIRLGRVAPSQRLIESEIKRATGATRSRIREALQRLEAEGLVVLEEFRGASVRSFSNDEVRQIYRARMALEGLAAHDFAVDGEADAKAQLARVQDELNALEHSGDHHGFARLNDRWHDLIIDGAGNEHVRTFVQRLRLPLYRLLFTAFFKPHRIDDANADHRRITAAIQAGDGPEAERLMRGHIADALAAVTDIGDDLRG